MSDPLLIPFPNPRMGAPELLIPDRKPVGPIELDLSNPITKGLQGAWPFQAGDLKNYGQTPFKDAVGSNCEWKVKEGRMMYGCEDLGGQMAYIQLDDADILPFANWDECSMFLWMVPTGQTSTSCTLVGDRYNTSGDYFIWNVDNGSGVTGDNGANNQYGYNLNPGIDIPDTGYLNWPLRLKAFGFSCAPFGEAGGYRWFYDGKIESYQTNGVNTGGHGGTTNQTNLLQGRIDRTLYGFVELVLMWDRRLTDAECYAISRDPWSVFKPIKLEAHPAKLSAHPK